MSVDLAARGLALQETVRARRLRILRRLADSIARVAGHYPAIHPAPPTIGADAAAISIASPKSWSLSAEPASGGYYPLYTGRATLVGASFRAPSPVFIDAITATVGPPGDPGLYPLQCAGPKLRFKTDAPKFELWMRMAPNATAGQTHELRVDGLRVATGFGKAASGANDYGARYVPVQFGDGSESQRTLRRIEVMITDLNGQGLPGTVVMDQKSFIAPWPQSEGLKVCVFGDSFTELGLGRDLGDLLGQADTWSAGLGATGWIANSGGSRSPATERWPVDVTPHGFDVVFDLNGINDNGLAASAAAYAALITPLYQAAITAKPETIIVATGPMSPSSTHNAAAGLQTVRDGKRLACAAFPRNAIFLDNLGDTTTPLAAHPWVIGTGRVGATVGDGNADLVTSADATHPSAYGNVYLAQRIAAETARAIQALIAAQ